MSRPHNRPLTAFASSAVAVIAIRWPLRQTAIGQHVSIQAHGSRCEPPSIRGRGARSSSCPTSTLQLNAHQSAVAPTNRRAIFRSGPMPSNYPIGNETYEPDAAIPLIRICEAEYGIMIPTPTWLNFVVLRLPQVAAKSLS